ncbi:MAG: BON domain-containing protein [Planctomycetales bacterium]|nr:BON domain-containing protein [Planctomycetales bacterium]
MELSHQWLAGSQERIQSPSSPQRVAVERLAIAELRKSNYPAVRLLSVHYFKGVLTLRGTVPSFYQKQVAQTIVRPVLGVGMLLNNKLQVDSRLPVGGDEPTNS